MVLPAFFFCSCLGAAEQVAANSAGTAVQNKLIPFEVTINGSKGGTWLFIEREGALYASKDAFDEWRVVLDQNVSALKFREQDYFPLTSIPGFEQKVDFANQSVEITFSPQAFAQTRLANEVVKKPVLNAVLPSMFLNYDLNYTRAREHEKPVPQDLSALTELGYSTGLGMLSSSFIGHNLTNDKLQGQGAGFTRLETSFTRDFSDKNLTLRIGDSYTKSSMAGRSVYFGGLSLGTNFGMTPGFVSQPLPVLTGFSATPSTVELYIDDVLRQVSNVPTGPFAIDNFPTLTGSGNARLVVRDQLGRETVVEQPFVTNIQLLNKGLNDWSIEAGKIRTDLGSDSSGYGTPFLGSFLRRGITSALTLEGHGELAKEQVNLGLGAISGLPFFMLGRAAFNTSNHQVLGTGRQWLLGVEYQNLHGSAMLDVQGASRNYHQLGQEQEFKPTKLQVAASWSYGDENFGSFSLGLAKLQRYEGQSVTTMTASYYKRIWKQSSLSVVVSHAASSNSTSNNMSLNLVIPLGSNRVASTYATHRGKQNDVYQTVTQNAGQDTNLNWRLLAGKQMDNHRVEAGAYYAGRYGTVSSDVSDTSEQTAMRLGANSALVFADGHLFATSTLQDSFAVAEIAGYENIGVGLGSNILTHTDKRGIALIPRLMPYQNNSIMVDPRELPISADIVSIEQIAVPAYRSAVKVVFPVRTGRGALVRIVLDDGEVAPAGALVSIVGDTEEFYVARRGEAFISGLQPKNHLIMKWQNQQCGFDVTLPPEEADVVPRVGPLTCTGLKR